MVLALFCICGSSLFAAYTPINGTWKDVGNDRYLIFLDNGSYYFVDVNAYFAVFERGSFKWENLPGYESKGKITTTAMAGTDGVSGFSHQTETEVERLRSWPSDLLRVSGSSQTGINTLYKKMFYNGAYEHSGAYLSDEGGASLLIVIDETSRIVVQENSLNSSSHAGVDYKGPLGNTSPPVISRIKTNGALSGEPETLTFGAATDLAALTVGAKTTNYWRVRSDYGKSPKAIDCRASKNANYLQGSSSDPTTALFSDSSSPFSWDISALTTAIQSLPVLRLDSIRGLQLQPAPDNPYSFSFVKHLPSRASLDSQEGLLPATYYEVLLDGVQNNTLYFGTGGDFPPVPKVVGGGIWNAGIFETGSGIVEWNPNPQGFHRDKRTLLTIRDVSTKLDVIRDFIVPATRSHMILTPFLVPGKTYLCSLTHETDSLRSSSYFGSSHTSYRTVNSFSICIPSGMGDPAQTLSIPATFSRTYGTEASLFVKGDGLGDTTYQWFWNGEPIPGQTASCLYLTKSSAFFSGAFHVIATSPAGQMRSNNSYLNPASPTASELILGKDARYRQSAPATVSLDTSVLADEEPGCYGFSAFLRGTDLQQIAIPSISPPGTQNQAFQKLLFYDESELAWSYGRKGMNFRTNSKTEFDSIFPTGNYAVRFLSSTSSVNLPLVAYPNAPVATLSGGAWINGKYAVARDSEITIQSNIFTDFRSGFGGHIFLQYGSRETELISDVPSVPASVSLTALADDSANKVSIAFVKHYDMKTSGSSFASASTYISSTVASIHILPHIIKQPESRTINSLTPHSLEIRAGGTNVTGSNSLAYQWTLDGNALFGENSPILRIGSARRPQSGSYACIVSNDVGSVVSASATLVVMPDPYEAFLDGFATSPEELGADHLDLDGDGTANLLEFLFQGDPTKPLAVISPTTSIDQKRFKFSYLRSSNSSSIQQDVEYAESLEGPWRLALEGVGNVTRSVVDLANGTQRVEVSIPFDSLRGFARLRAHRR